MKLCKKVFLFTVGIITISFDEISKAYIEAEEAVDAETKSQNKQSDKKESS